VVNGQTRSVTTSSEGVTIGAGGGVPFSQGINGTNRWISDGLPVRAPLSWLLCAVVTVNVRYCHGYCARTVRYCHGECALLSGEVCGVAKGNVGHCRV
jgi:hypothetical protein